MSYMIERKEGGSKGLGFNGCKAGIKTRSFFMVWLPRENEEIS